jgi:predicted FMN-binding regulatory protein PaiB
MYQPSQFKIDDVETMHALMRARPFATLVSAGQLGLCNPLADHYEGQSAQRCARVSLSARKSPVESMLRAIVGFRLEIARIEG